MPRWTAPPGWPAPPPGWSPPPGWVPDPAWGPPPPGWSFWQDDARGHSTATLVAVGVSTALLGVLLGAAVIGGVSVVGREVTSTTTVAAEPVPEPATVVLSVHSDGCGVVRTEPAQPLENLTWSVRDSAGFEVLGRNAESETRYRYFQPGTYTVVLTAWGGGSYVPVSNEVTIRC